MGRWMGGFAFDIRSSDSLARHQGVLDELYLTGLRIQRMPKDPEKPFDHPPDYQVAVCVLAGSSCWLVI